MLGLGIIIRTKTSVRRAKISHHVPDLAFAFGSCSPGVNGLDVDARPEHHLATKRSQVCIAAHARTIELEGIETPLDEEGNDRVDLAATMLVKLAAEVVGSFY